MNKRKVVSLPTAGDKSAGRLVEVGGMLFSSSITGLDPDTAVLSSVPEQQFEVAFRNLQRLLDAAGVSTDDLGLVQMAVPRPNLRGNYVSVPWLAMFPDDHDRPARKVDIYPLPDGELVRLEVVGVRGARRRQIMMPGVAHGDPRPAGVGIGDLVFSSSISGSEPATGQLIEDPRRQVRQALQNMEMLVQQAGGTKDDIAHVLIFVRDRADNDDVLAAWLETFPVDGDRPARKNVFDDHLQGTPTVVQLQMVAVLGQGKRQNFEVDGAAKRHPNPLGVQLGNLLFSAGINGRDPRGNSVELQASAAFRNVRALLDEAGGSLDDVGQVTITVSDYADEPAIMRQWRELFPDPSDEPARHLTAFGGREGYQVQVHVVAALDGGSPSAM